MRVGEQSASGSESPTLPGADFNMERLNELIRDLVKQGADVSKVLPVSGGTMDIIQRLIPLPEETTFYGWTCYEINGYHVFILPAYNQEEIDEGVITHKK